MSLSDEPDEIMDLVNEQDEVIGRTTREEVARLGLRLPGLVRASNIFLMNRKGEIWAPRRTAHKKIAPNGLDYSVGEHVKSGEDYVSAAIRGMREELNLAISDRDLQFIGKINDTPVGVPYLCSLFVYKADRVPGYNKNDFVSYEWLSPAVFLRRMRAGQAGKNDLVLALELLLNK